MDIHHLKIFISVHRNSSFSKASKELHISQPTISEHIKNLENELDCTLFDRLGRSILPTAQAEILLPHALQVVEELTKLKEAMSLGAKEIKGDIIISASTIPGTYLLPKIATAFKQKYPETRFQILINDTNQSTAKVESHEIHLAVTGGLIDNKALNKTILTEDELVCVASKDMAAKAQKNLANLPILIREQGSGTRHAMEEIFHHLDISINPSNIVATLGSTAAIKEALIAGLGFSIISRMAVKEEIRTGVLQQIQLQDAKMSRPIVLVSHKKRTLPRRYQAFIEMMIGKVKK